ncbi:MAG: radical SAM protein [Proteobacteria bacterium]|nr:radical SAM protein [Pseudomonadota bacterium]
MKAARLKKKEGLCPFNPGYLKLLLAVQGMSLGKGVAEEVGFTLSTRRGVAGGVDLILPGDLWVNVPVDKTTTEKSPYCLEKKKGGYFLTGYGNEIKVEPVRQPHFYERVTSKGTPFYQIAALHGGSVYISPTNRCQFFDDDLNCRFCDEKKTFYPIAREFISVEEILEIIEVAFNEGVADSVDFNIGYFDTEDRGISFLEPYINAVKRNFDTIVAVDAQPPKSNKWIDKTYAMGVDKLSYHMEIFDMEVFDSLCPGKAKEIGWERYVEALKYAAGVFPSGAVSSNLIIGLEAPASTMEGIDLLTGIGVVPILPIFRPIEGAALEVTLPDMDEMSAILAHLYSSVKASSINMTWSKNISTYMTPLEGRYFSGDDAKLQVVMQNIYKTKIGGKAVRSIAGLRRRLKVKEVEDSFESSGL